MNVASWLAVVTVPLAIVPWALVHVMAFDRVPEGSLGPFGWLPVLLMSAVVAVLAETAVLRLGWRRKLTRKVVLGLFLTNLLGVAVAACMATEHACKNPPIAYVQWTRSSLRTERTAAHSARNPGVSPAELRRSPLKLIREHARVKRATTAGRNPAHD
jgi:hypothetical protein